MSISQLTFTLPSSITNTSSSATNNSESAAAATQTGNLATTTHTLQSSQTSVKEFQSDSPLIEVINFLDNHLLGPLGYCISNPASQILDDTSTKTKQQCKIYDVSFSPAKLINVDKTNDQRVGWNSITLSKMGWFPTGKLKILQNFEEIGVIVRDTDGSIMFEKGNEERPIPPSDSTSTGFVPPPSQLLTEHLTRFAGISDPQPSSTPTMTEKVKLETKRQKTLDERMSIISKTLENSKKKNSKTSQKVKEMLMKSKAKGEKKLLEGDRVYFECIFVDDSDNDDVDATKILPKPPLTHLFFSTNTSLGKLKQHIVSSLKLPSTSLHVSYTIWIEKEEIGGYAKSLIELGGSSLKSLIDFQRENILSKFQRVVIMKG